MVLAEILNSRRVVTDTMGVLNGPVFPVGTAQEALGDQALRRVRMSPSRGQRPPVPAGEVTGIHESLYAQQSRLEKVHNMAVEVTTVSVVDTLVA